VFATVLDVAWRNPPVPWSELERRLSGRPTPEGAPVDGDGWVVPDGGDAPAYSRKRPAYDPPAVVRRRSTTASVELHCHSCFSFLDGASTPEELVEEAARLDLDALALTDHDGLYGIVRFAEAAREVGLPTVFGAELTLGRTAPQPGVADPGVAEPGTPGPPPRTRARGIDVAVGDPVTFEGLADPGALPGESHLVVLARDPRGYALLARAISEAQLRGEKGAPSAVLADLVALAGAGAAQSDQGHWQVLTGCRKGALARALDDGGPAVAARQLARLVEAFGRDHVAVELWDHGDPLDAYRNDALAGVALAAGVELVATNNVHYAHPGRRPLAATLAAVRSRRSLDELDGWLPAAATAHLRSGDEQARRFARWPGVVERAAELGRSCAFDLRLVAPELPPYPCPDGLDEMAFLRRLTEEGATRRYGPRHAPTVAGAWEQIDHELTVIEALNFPGYFLVVWDIVEFCRRNDIYCQGRGSAANSAVCFSIGVTKADAVRLGLLFERFLSAGRDGPPDIDLDIESNRREEVIQYVYGRYGRQHTALVANVITYRGRSAVRDVAGALGYAVGQQDAWAKQVDRWSGLGDAKVVAADRGGGSPPVAARRAGATDVAGIPPLVLELAGQVEHLPRHLGIHSGGMVICDRPVVEVCPVEWARMEGRSVLQWDKDDCAAAGLVKFDLLGLGMLTALHEAVDLVAQAHGVELDLAALPQEDAVYDMLCRADTIGVFQIESRAQMATLPRLRPRTFYDLVVEVALIRPGPIQGGSVHPYIRRRNGAEPVTYLHPLLEPSLAKTLGIPLFQEQLMQIAIDVGGFTPTEADQLRQAMGSKRSAERMERLHARFLAGAAERDVSARVAEQVWAKLAAFASYGFPESHSVSFAYLVYSSSWLKLHHPAAFCAALLNAQPMGFYSPHSLVQDARRHGVEVRSPDLNASAVGASLEWPERAPATVERAGALVGEAFPGAAEVGERCIGDDGRADARSRHPTARVEAVTDLGEVSLDDAGNAQAQAAAINGGFRPGPQPSVRLGLSSVRHLGDDVAERIVADRHARGPYSSLEDLRRRVTMPVAAMEALATAGALACLRDGDGRPLDRRRALWVVGAVAQTDAGRLPGIVTGTEPPRLPGMDERDEAVADLWSTGVSAEGHPTRFLRDRLDAMGVVPACRLLAQDDRSKVLVAGVVTHRQRPATAAGTTFVNLEDETGLVNVIVSRGCWLHHRSVARDAPALLVRGRLEVAEGVANVIAERLEPLDLAGPPSRDFR
jgi:error-prone DNA polymerase